MLKLWRLYLHGPCLSKSVAESCRSIYVFPLSGHQGVKELSSGYFFVS